RVITVPVRRGTGGAGILSSGGRPRIVSARVIGRELGFTHLPQRHDDAARRAPLLGGSLRSRFGVRRVDLAAIELVVILAHAYLPGIRLVREVSAPLGEPYEWNVRAAAARGGASPGWPRRRCASAARG